MSDNKQDQSYIRFVLEQKKNQYEILKKNATTSYQVRYLEELQKEIAELSKQVSRFSYTYDDNQVSTAASYLTKYNHNIYDKSFVYLTRMEWENVGRLYVQDAIKATIEDIAKQNIDLFERMLKNLDDTNGYDNPTEEDDIINATCASYVIYSSTAGYTVTVEIDSDIDNRKMSQHFSVSVDPSLLFKTTPYVVEKYR